MLSIRLNLKFISKCQRDKNNEIIHIAGVQANDDLFDRLENVRFFRLFTLDGDMEYLAAVIPNP
jgi:hypothetical protein